MSSILICTEVTGHFKGRKNEGVGKRTRVGDQVKSDKSLVCEHVIRPIVFVSGSYQLGFYPTEIGTWKPCSS